MRKRQEENHKHKGWASWLAALLWLVSVAGQSQPYTLLTWNVENLRVVAFVNRPYQNNDCTQLQVLNANDLRLQTVSAVHGIEAAEAPVQRTCYNLQGQRISQPTKGIYIEKVVTPSGIRCLKRVR